MARHNRWQRKRAHEKEPKLNKKERRKLRKQQELEARRPKLPSAPPHPSYGGVEYDDDEYYEQMALAMCGMGAYVYAGASKKDINEAAEKVIGGHYWCAGTAAAPTPVATG